MNLIEVFQKVVFLVGAGASKDADCKLSADMLTSLEEAILASSSPEEYNNLRADFSEIYQFILASLSYQIKMNKAAEVILNIEDFVMTLRQLIDKEFVLPYPLIGNWNDKITKWEMRNGNIFLRFKDFISYQLVSDWTKFDESKAQNLLSPIKTFLATSEQVKLNVFSLNYDLVFESVFNTPTTRVLDNGFSEKSDSEKPDSEKKVRFWSADFDNKLSSAKINLYKLHGSIDWEYDTVSENILVKDDINDGREPLIIFGSYSKMLSFDPFLYTLSKFRTLLEEATIFIVIGYSFHDKYINNLLIQQLSKNTTEDDVPKKLIVVDPGLKDITEADFAMTLKRIQESKSINDIINFKQISPDRLKLIPMKTIDFFRDYFADNAKRIQEELEEVERGDQPFS